MLWLRIRGNFIKTPVVIDVGGELHLMEKLLEHPLKGTEIEKIVWLTLVEMGIVKMIGSFTKMRRGSGVGEEQPQMEKL